jgi:mannan endo-1,4-beta-mannosidase
MSWHWNAPTDLLDKMLKDDQGKDLDARWYKGFYTYATTFDLATAIDDPNSDNYKLLLRDIDAIAVQLQKLSDARVPVLWRPLHEAEGGWFWWGAKGPDAFVKLWRLMFDRLTKVHKLHNLIWVFTVGNNPQWYPGDAYVDVLGVDAYPSDHSDTLGSTWDSLKKLYDGKKVLALSEFGGVPDIPRMRKFGVEWAYFVSWPGEVQPPGTAKPALIRIYRDISVKNKAAQ